MSKYYVNKIPNLTIDSTVQLSGIEGAETAWLVSEWGAKLCGLGHKLPLRIPGEVNCRSVRSGLASLYRRYISLR